MRSPFAERFSNASHHPRCLAVDSDIQDVNLADQTVLLGRSRMDQCERRAVPGGVDGLTEGALLRPLHKSGRLREGRLTERSIRSIIIRRARDAGVQGRISGNNQRVAARRAWRMRAPLWPRCSPPGAGAPPSCRCATRRKNARGRAPWRGFATGVDEQGRECSPPSLGIPVFFPYRFGAIPS